MEKDNEDQKKRLNGKVVAWMEKVSDEQYQAVFRSE